MKKIRYEKCTWPEIKEFAAQDALIIIPTAATEEHGPHLPLDTDTLITEYVAHNAAERSEHPCLVLPAVWIGFESHHMDFPGTIDADWELFIKYGLSITRSLAHHGFRKMLILNGHGSNKALIEVIARQTVIDNPHTFCGAVCWWEFEAAQKVFNDLRESEVTSHACELETSAYLAIDPDMVQMDKAVRDMKYPLSDHYWSDLAGRKPDPSFKNAVRHMEIWGAISDTGVRGDATKGTAEKGRVTLEAAIGEMVELIKETVDRPIVEAIDHH